MWISSYQFRYDFVHTVDCNKKESLPVSHAVGKISISPTIVIRVRTLHYSNTYCNFIERYHFPLGKSIGSMQRIFCAKRGCQIHSCPCILSIHVAILMVHGIPTFMYVATPPFDGLHHSSSWSSAHRIRCWAQAPVLNLDHGLPFL